MGAKIRKKITYFEMILKEKFPDITVEFYLSKRKRYLHMGLEQSLPSIKNYKDFKEEIYKFLSVNLDKNFKMLEPPLFVPTVGWKHDCILIQYEPHK